MTRPFHQILYIPETGDVFHIFNDKGAEPLVIEKLQSVPPTLPESHQLILANRNIIRGRHPNWSVQVWGYKCKVKFSILREIAMRYKLRHIFYMVFWPSMCYMPEKRVKITYKGRVSYSPTWVEFQKGNPDYGMY
jgi:hypothetical protein